MPGIVGYVDFEHNREENLLEEMLTSITYSDKQHVEHSIAPPLWIGRSDLTTFNPEHQPFVGKDGSTIVFFQGNIVNKDELGYAGSNGELVLRLYDEMGTNFVHEVKGHFTAVIWDAYNERLLIANDRFGRYPLYYSKLSDEGLVFGSEVKALILHPGVSRALNDQAIIDFIRTLHLWGSETFFTAVQLLPYASILEFGHDSFKVTKYWEYQFIEAAGHRNLEACRDTLHTLLAQAVKRAVGECNNVGITLSGGLDTRIIAAHVPRDRKLTALSFGAPGCDDDKLARRVAETLGFEHYFIPLTADYIPKYGERVIHSMDGSLQLLVGQELLFEELEREKGIDMKVVGSCSSTLFGGFLERTLINDTYADDELFTYLLEKHSMFTDEELQELLSESYYEKTEDICQSSFKESFARAKKLHRLPANIIDYINFTERGMRWLAMSAPLLSRQTTETVNLYDYDLVDFMLTISPEFRLQRKLCVEVLKHYYPGLARIPLQKTGCSLYSSEVKKQFVGLVRSGLIRCKRIAERATKGKRAINLAEQVGNYSHYLREQQGYVEDILLGERTLSRGIFNQVYLKELVRDHMIGRTDNTLKIAVLLSLELWFRMFIDGDVFNQKLD